MPDEASATRLIEAAAALGPLIKAHRAELATARDLPPPLAEALDAAGLTRLWLPRAVGGAELSPDTYIRVIETLARLDGAVGWCAAIASGGGRMVGLLPPDVAADLFSPAALLPGRGCLCNVGNPAGVATRAGGGWRVNGRWNYSSFIRHSTWTMGVCVARDTDGTPRRDAAGAPELRGAIVPTASVRILDTWNAGGLRATGSHDFDIDNLLVPAERTIRIHPIQPAPAGAGPLYALPFITAFAIAITPVALGLARAAIDALVELAGYKTPIGAATPLRDLPSLQADVARAEAELRAARAFLFEAVGALWDAAGAEGAPGAQAMPKRALVRLACWNAARASRQVVALMHEAAGTSALDERNRFAACLRDVNAAGQHLAYAQRHLEVIGRVFLGMDAGIDRF